jgi:hypothetical protein
MLVYFSLFNKKIEVNGELILVGREKKVDYRVPYFATHFFKLSLISAFRILA